MVDVPAGRRQRNLPGHRLAVVGHFLPWTDDEAALGVSVQLSESGFDGGWKQMVVGVQEYEVRTPTRGYPGVASGRRAGVLLTDEPRLRMRTHDLLDVPRRAVVDYQHLV